MPTKNLNRIFAPKTIAIVGASRREGSVGNTVTKNLIAGQFPGALIAVNRNYESVEGIQCHAELSSITEKIDLAILCTPAESVPDLIDQCGRLDVGGVIVLAAGFRETGQGGRELETQLKATSQRYPSMRILGPNSLGLISTHNRLNASFADVVPKPGKIALLSQSGALGTAILDWAIDEGVGFSHFVSFGNVLDISVADLIDYLAEDPHTESIVMYLESIQYSRAFMSAARAFSKRKPIIAMKAGRFEATAKAAALHTGSMVGVDEVYDAAFARAGVVRVDEYDDLIQCAELLAHAKTSQWNHPSDMVGNRFAVLTNAGGAGLMTADLVLQSNARLAAFTETTQSQLRALLRSDSSLDQSPIANPVDLFGDATPERFESSINAVLKDENVDALIVVLAPQALTLADEIAERMIAATSKTNRPILAVWLGGRSVQASRQKLTNAGVPTYSTPAKAIRALSYLVKHRRNQAVLHETPRSVSVDFQRNREAMRISLSAMNLSDSQFLTESSSKALLESYEIPTTRPIATNTPDELVKYAATIGYPVAIKIIAPELLHKTEVGGVILNVANEAEVRTAYETLRQRHETYAQAANTSLTSEFQGVSVQPMAIDPNGRELILGARRDPVFGMVMMIGAGGVHAEVVADHALELPPLNERLARRMLQSLRCWPMLQNYRGKPAVDLDELIRVLMRFSYLLADHSEIVEIDVNPLLVTPDRVVALDASIILEAGSASALKLNRSRPDRYAHLAICPYPEQYVRDATLADGGALTLRPIQPEDEPQWRLMLQDCSEETIRMRFRYLFEGSSHEMAARFCYTDYDRELAIVAEVPSDKDSRPIAGVARLVANADHREAEFAVLVADAWQGRGVGSILIDECLQIAEGWGIELVTAEVDPRNRRMLQMFAKRGFEFDRSSDDDVLASKRLSVDSAS